SEPDLRAIALEHAEQAVVVALRAVDAHLEEPVHLAVHRFPFAATAEHRRWRVGNGLYDGKQLRGHGRRATIEEVARGHALRRIVLHVSLGEVDPPGCSRFVLPGFGCRGFVPLLRHVSEVRQMLMARWPAPSSSRPSSGTKPSR